jgi:hypothetical protein
LKHLVAWWVFVDKTSQIYAKVTHTKINEDMTKFEKRIKGQYESVGAKPPKPKRRKGA